MDWQNLTNQLQIKPVYIKPVYISVDRLQDEASSSTLYVQ